MCAKVWRTKHARDARSDVSRYNVHALVICSCPRMDNANFCYILRLLIDEGDLVLRNERIWRILKERKFVCCVVRDCLF